MTTRILSLVALSVGLTFMVLSIVSAKVEGSGEFQFTLFALGSLLMITGVARWKVGDDKDTNEEKDSS